MTTFETVDRIREARFESYRRMGKACNEALEIIRASRERAEKELN